MAKKTYYIKKADRNTVKIELPVGSSDKIEKVDIDLELLSKFKSGVEKRIAKSLIRKYFSEFTIENISDRNTLGQVIFLEVNQLRIQEKLNEIYHKDAKAIPSELLETMNKNSDVLIKLKNTLGLSKSKEKISTVDALKQMMKRHEKWRDENQASRTLKCPHCYNILWLKIKTEAWDVQKHPFFKDTFLCNKALIENYGKKVLINAQFIAKVFETSFDYIDKWLLPKLGLNKEEPQEQTQKQISNALISDKLTNQEGSYGEETSKGSKIEVKEKEVINGEEPAIPTN